MNNKDLHNLLTNYSLKTIVYSLIEYFGLDTIKELVADFEYWNQS